MKGKVKRMKMNIQFFGTTGVNPVNAMEFGVNTSGRTGNTSTVVKDAESLSISIDGNVEEWDAMDAAGWKRRLMTAKSLSISMGNDYVAGLFMKMGQDCNSIFTVTFPNGDKLVMPCVINVTSLGGDATAADAMEWEALSDGKPEYIKADEA